MKKLLHINIHHLLSLGFGIILFFLISLSGIGFFSIKKIIIIEDLSSLGYQLAMQISELRREEKNLMLKGFNIGSAQEWQSTFMYIKDLVYEIEKAGFITKETTIDFFNKVIAYEYTFTDFVVALQSKDLNEEDIKLFDERLNTQGRLLLNSGRAIAFSCLIAKKNFEEEIGRFLFWLSFFGILLSLLLSWKVVVLVKQSLQKRKKAEEELQKASEQLRETQMELVQTSKMATVGVLAGSVVHAINNPISAILNNLQLIKMLNEQKREDFDKDKFIAFVTSIEECALRCKNITQSLLSFSHTPADKFQAVLIHDVIEKAVFLLERQMQFENIQIKREFSPDQPKVSGDPQLLQQAIFDIISNARWAIKKKSQRGDDFVTIKTQNESKNNGVVIFISDTGIGIPQENIQKIFEPFFTTKAVGEGTGLGLAIVYKIVEQHHGGIQVESEIGKGTTFKIYLPLASQQLTA